MIKKRKYDPKRAALRSFLKEGLGVEDIAIKLGCNVEFIRRDVKRMRQSCEIARMFGDRS